MAKTAKNSQVIGWRERVSLPDWGIKRIKAKIDTGARTSAIHVSTLEELDDGSVRFEVVVREGPSRKTSWVTARPVRRTTIKSSSGHRQKRIVIVTRIRIGEIEREVELTLVSRKGMLCRMLVGRTALSGILVDPRRINLVSALPRTKSNQKEDRQ